MPGGGKSTVGRQLARRLGWSFVDTDAQIEQRLGESIRAFFEREGEEPFRDIEQACRMARGDDAIDDADLLDALAALVERLERG